MAYFKVVTGPLGIPCVTHMGDKPVRTSIEIRARTKYVYNMTFLCDEPHENLPPTCILITPPKVSDNPRIEETMLVRRCGDGNIETRKMTLDTVTGARNISVSRHPQRRGCDVVQSHSENEMDMNEATFQLLMTPFTVSQTPENNFKLLQ